MNQVRNVLYIGQLLARGWTDLPWQRNEKPTALFVLQMFRPASSMSMKADQAKAVKLELASMKPLSNGIDSLSQTTSNQSISTGEST